MISRRTLLASISTTNIARPKPTQKKETPVPAQELKNGPMIYDIEELMKDVEVLQRKVMDDELCIQLLYAQAMVMIFLNIFRR